MMENLKYQITNKILLTIRQIEGVLGEIKSLHLTHGARVQIQYRARELSTFASTSIEGNPLLLTDVRRILKNHPTHMRDTEREILNYNRALDYVYTQVKSGRFSLSIPELEKIQSMVVEGLMESPDDCGHLRVNPVIIRDPRRPDAVVFIPPDHQDVPRLTKELCDFITQSKGIIDPILLAGLFHRQAVIIHPFMDGNGRTTRLITTALLGASGLDFFELFSFENYYNQNVTKYFRYVGLYGDYYDHEGKIDFTSWLEYFTEGILDELKRVQKSILSLPQKKKMPIHFEIVLNYIKEYGSIRQSEYAEISARSLAARKQDFSNMLDQRLIKSVGQGKSTYYIFNDEEDEV